MKVAILGGGGCFGLNTARHLLRQGHQVFGIGRSPQKPESFWLGTDRLGYTYTAYHVTHEPEYIMALLDRERPQVIINYAAQGESAASFGIDNWRYYETNCVGLIRLVAQVSTRGWLERFIHIGTSEVYGSVSAPSKETDAIVPSSPYAASKVAFDLHLQAIGKALKFPYNIVRPSNCYTPGQQLHRIVPKAMLYALTNRRLPLHAGGRAQKSYLHADDLSFAIELIMNSAPLRETYNVGPDEPISIYEVVDRCAEIARMPISRLVDIVDDRQGQDSCYWLDSSKVKALGWQRQIPTGEGLRDVYDWVHANREELSGMSPDFRMRA
jgi:dTDP-glucose 4,6-dehydratase